MKIVRPSRAFTLLELLVAISITLLLAGIMLSVTTETLNLWRRTQGNFTASAQAKLALDMIERDLLAVTSRKTGTGSIWLAVDVINIPAILVNHGWQTGTLMKPAGAESIVVVPTTANPVIAEARFGLSGAWLRFISATAESTTELAVPRAISYQIARRPLTGTNMTATNPAEVRYSFFRAAVSNANSFTAGNNVTAAAYDSNSQTPASTRNATTVTNPNSSDVLATNVVDFGVWLYARNPDGSLRRIFPSSNADFTHTATDAVAPGDATMIPAVADVMIRILTEEGARQIDVLERNNGSIIRPATFASDALWWWAVVEANSKVYTRRIEVMGVAL